MAAAVPAERHWARVVAFPASPRQYVARPCGSGAVEAAKVAYDQTKRLLAMDTKLGPDACVLTEVEAEDVLSKPFVYRIKFATEAAPADVKNLLGTEVTLFMGRPEETGTAIGRRPVHGHFSRLTRGVAQRGNDVEWRAEVVPALWFLSRTTDCRIFQQKSVTDIISEVLQLHGVTNVQMKTLGTYDPLEYCVQYRETALNFISRLMEQNGIFFWHEHEEGRHTLVIADSNSSATQPPFTEELPITGRDDYGGIRRLDEEFAIRSGKWTMRDFNFETPSQQLEVSEPTKLSVEQIKSRERFDYPGLYPNSGRGKQVARIEIEREEAFYQQREGESSCACLDPGMVIKLDGRITDGEVLVTEVFHSAQDYSHWSDQAWGKRMPVEPSYDNRFRCMPKRIPFRPERETPKPFVQGPQTAIVTGPSGEEIHTDKYGRVKVQFHWDRLGHNDDNSSCWVRVSQGWAGKGWGQIHIPRVGHEVIVDFLEGDPDRPIITGRVYNAENTVPYGLPANKTQSGIKTNSSKGGGGFNEYRFEDKKGSEQIYIHAEKDYDTLIENNETRKVGGKGEGNRTTDIKKDETLTVGGNKKTTVMGNFDETIVGKETRTVTGNVTETYAANETRTIAGSITKTVAGSVTETIAGSITKTVGGAVTNVIGGSMTEVVAGGVTQVSPAAITVVSSASINHIAPNLIQTAPSWFTTGATNGDAYGFATSNAGMKIENQGVGIVTVGMKMDNFGIAIANGGIEIKNKSMKSYTYAFSLKTGFTLYT